MESATATTTPKRVERVCAGHASSLRNLKKRRNDWAETMERDSVAFHAKIQKQIRDLHAIAEDYDKCMKDDIESVERVIKHEKRPCACSGGGEEKIREFMSAYTYYNLPKCAICDESVYPSMKKTLLCSRHIAHKECIN